MDPRDLPADWPFRSAGRRLRAGPHDWWLIDHGPAEAPVLLALHGLGASGHSFRRAIPGLAARYRVIVPDLPGQGCSRAGASNRLGCAPMAEDLWRLCEALGVLPAVVLGHSAGAALALQMTLMRPVGAIVGLNAALGRFEGAAGVVFPVVAQGLAALPFLPTALARLWGTQHRVDRLLASTGSTLDAEGRAQYLRLVQDPDHVAGALGMMAQWRLDALLVRLPEIRTRTLLIAGRGDRTVPPQVSRAAARRLPAAELRELPGGHLVHEEAEDGLSAAILHWLQTVAPAPRII